MLLALVLRPPLPEGLSHCNQATSIPRDPIQAILSLPLPSPETG